MNDISIIPEQKKGSKVTYSRCIAKNSVSDAEELFAITKTKLLDINNWHELGVSSYFCLYDEKGTRKDFPATGDYIRIGLPAPGTVAGDGFDWVIIERKDELKDDDHESFGLRLRPSRNPVSDRVEISHFFTDDATSTFIIERKGKSVTANYYGRNEVANVKGVSKLFDKMRNIVVAISGKLGISKIHWKKFINNIIDENYRAEEPEE